MKLLNQALNKLKVHFSSSDLPWETPQKLFDELNAKHHFTIDVCASKKNTKCKHFWAEKDNCLKKDWKGQVCWMNPPYGRGIEKFIAKAFDESKHAKIVCLVPARTDTKWWHLFWGQPGVEVKFIKGRLTFKGAKHSAPFPSAIVIMDRRGINEKKAA